jgi:hypothetical protein
MASESSFQPDDEEDLSTSGYLPNFRKTPPATPGHQPNSSINITEPNWGGGRDQLVPTSKQRGNNQRNQDIRTMFPPSRQGRGPPQPNADASKFPLTMPLLWLHSFQRDLGTML